MPLRKILKNQFYIINASTMGKPQKVSKKQKKTLRNKNKTQYKNKDLFLITWLHFKPLLKHNSG